jgi:hypothetical protein
MLATSPMVISQNYPFNFFLAPFLKFSEKVELVQPYFLIHFIFERWGVLHFCTVSSEKQKLNKK